MGNLSENAGFYEKSSWQRSFPKIFIANSFYKVSALGGEFREFESLDA